MSIPTNDQGYRGNVEALIMAVEAEARASQALVDAKRAVGRAREDLNTSVVKMIAHEKKVVLGPDGGK